MAIRTYISIVTNTLIDNLRDWRSYPIQMKRNEKKARAVLIADKIDFKVKNCNRQRRH